MYRESGGLHGAGASESVLIVAASRLLVISQSESPETCPEKQTLLARIQHSALVSQHSDS